MVDAVNTEIANLRSALESPAEEIKTKISDLQKVLMKIGESMAQSSGTAASGTSSKDSEGSSSGTYDADVKDEKK